jgi:uncharacterized membrane protein YhaH (DUF805 family)
MNLEEAVSNCVTKYADFEGRASKSEYWWWILFIFLASTGFAIVNEKLCDLFWLVVLLPTVAVTTRRLHDTDRSGWWQLINLLPFIGFILMIIWCVQEPVEPNRFQKSLSAES